MATLRELRRRQNHFQAELDRKGWYHSFELPDGARIEGCMSIEWLRERWARLPIPADLSGKRVLDIGPWDGWFSFEAERRGAQVTSIDRVELATYRQIHRRLASTVDYRILDLYELPAAGLGRFDIVLCLGVLYHLKHPVLGLEIACALATEVAIVETFVIEGDPEIPVMEFYETDELNEDMDNWVGPTANCVLAMCRAAGFARVEVLAADAINLTVACWRKWEPEPAEPAMEPPELLAAVNSITFGINFASTRDEYLTCWFRAAAESLVREALCLEVGEFGAPAVFVRRREDGAWHANFRLPPGTPKGWNTVRLRLRESRFGAPLRIAVDLPVRTDRIRVTGVRDSAAWTPDTTTGTLSCWIEGLPENADRHNVRVWLGEHRMNVLWVGAGQVNASVPEVCPAGANELRVECGGVRSEAVEVAYRPTLNRSANIGGSPAL